MGIYVFSRKLLFDLAGRLVGIERPGEPEVVITHPDEPDDPSETLIEFGEGDAWLRLIDDSAWLNDSGWIQVAGVDGRIDRVVSSEGIEVAYEYAQAGPDGTTLLSKASRPYPTGGEPSFGRRFEWTNERLSRIVDQLASDRDHIVVENTYDGLGRVTEQLNATGDVLTFHYGVRWQSDTWVDAADYTTVVNEASGDHISYKYGPRPEQVFDVAFWGEGVHGVRRGEAAGHGERDRGGRVEDDRVVRLCGWRHGGGGGFGSAVGVSHRRGGGDDVVRL